MSFRTDIAQALWIAKKERRLDIRGIKRDRRRQLKFAIWSIVYLVALGPRLPNAYAAGTGLGSVGDIPYGGVLLTLLPVVLAGLVAIWAGYGTAQYEIHSTELTIIHPRAAMFGILCSIAYPLGLWWIGPIFLFMLTFLAGVETPSVILTAVVLMVVLLGWAAVWGYTIGVWVARHVRNRPVVQLLLKLVLLFGFVFCLFILLPVDIFGIRPEMLTALAGSVVFEPIYSYGALAFAGTEISTGPLLSGLVLLAVFVFSIPVGVATGTRQARAFLLRDPPERIRGHRRFLAGGFNPPWPVNAFRAGHLAWRHLLVATRDPQQLTHALLVELSLLFYAGLLSLGELDIPIIYLLMIAATVLAGVAFCLNPLGEDRRQGELLFVTTAGAKTRLRARVLAGLVVSAPLVICGSMFATVDGTSAETAIRFAVVTLLLCVPSTGLAFGLGAFKPIYEERQLLGTVTLVPSLGVLFGHTIVVMVGTCVGLWLSGLVVSGSLTAARTSLLVVYLFVTIVVSYGGYRYAASRLRSLTIE